jgi:hypothetical protein
MNDRTAAAIVQEWIGVRDTALASRLGALIPQPDPADAWAVVDGRVVTLTERSLFVVSAAAQPSGDADLSFGRAIVTDDGNTIISFEDGPISREHGREGRWTRKWNIDFHKKPRDFAPLRFATDPRIGEPTKAENLARQVAGLAGWPVGDPALPPRPR